MAITLNGTTGITTPDITSEAGLTVDGVSFASGAPANTLVTTSGGNVGIGTSSPSAKLDLQGTSAGAEMLEITHSGASQPWKFNSGENGVTNESLRILRGTSGEWMRFHAGLGTVFYYDGAERMRIDSSGRLLVGNTSHTDGSMFQSSQTSLNAYRTSTTAANGILGVYSDIGGTKTVRAYFRADGGLANYSANNVNLSDERLKKDITLAGNYLDKICAIPVKTFRYKDQLETEDLTLGVIAQDVQQIAPELVSQEGFGLDSKENYLSVYQTDLQYALMKCIQEQQALIQAQQATIDSLETRIAALEAA